MTGTGDNDGDGLTPMVHVWDAGTGKKREVPFSDVVENEMETEALIDGDMESMSDEDWKEAAFALDLPAEILADDKNRRRAIYLFHALQSRWTDPEDFDANAPDAIRLALTCYSAMSDNDVALLFLAPKTQAPTPAEVEATVEVLNREEVAWEAAEKAFHLDQGALEGEEARYRFCYLFRLGRRMWGGDEEFDPHMIALMRVGMVDNRDTPLEQIAAAVMELEEEKEEKK